MDIFKLGDKILALLEAGFGFWNNQICLALETALFTAGKRYARHFLGVFEAATIHYAVAKIFGPLFFNPACSLR